jgi:ABC-type sugar transport system permease subunit
MTLKRRRQNGGRRLRAAGDRVSGLASSAFRSARPSTTPSRSGTADLDVDRYRSTWTQAFHNTNLWTALRNNGLLLLSVPFALAIPLCIAVLLHQRVAGWRIFRSIYFLPTAISWVVLGLVAERFFAYQGTLNSIIHAWVSRTPARTCWAMNPRRSSHSASPSSSR